MAVQLHGRPDSKNPNVFHGQTTMNLTSVRWLHLTQHYADVFSSCWLWYIHAFHALQPEISGNISHSWFYASTASLPAFMLKKSPCLIVKSWWFTMGEIALTRDDGALVVESKVVLAVLHMDSWFLEQISPATLRSQLGFFFSTEWKRIQITFQTKKNRLLLHKIVDLSLLDKLT